MKRAVESDITKGNPLKKPAWPEMHKLATLWRLYKTDFPWPKPRCTPTYVWMHPDRKHPHPTLLKQPTGAEKDAYVKYVSPCYSMFGAVHVVAGRFLAHMAYEKREWKLPKGKAARDEVLLDFVAYCLDELRAEVNVHAKKETGGVLQVVWSKHIWPTKYTWDATQLDKLKDSNRQ